MSCVEQGVRRGRPLGGYYKVLINPIEGSDNSLSN
jgi:hypothetical protein